MHQCPPCKRSRTNSLVNFSEDCLESVKLKVIDERKMGFLDDLQCTVEVNNTRQLRCLKFFNAIFDIFVKLAIDVLSNKKIEIYDTS